MGLGRKKVHRCGKVIWKAYLWDDREKHYHLWFLDADRNPLTDGKCPRCGETIVPSDLDDPEGLPAATLRKRLSDISDVLPKISLIADACTDERIDAAINEVLVAIENLLNEIRE